MRLFLLCVLASVLCLSGCAFAQDVMRGIEPLLDTVAQTAANSAANAVAEQIGDQMPAGVDHTAIVGGTAGVIMGIYTAIKGALWAYNRDPKTA